MAEKRKLLNEIDKCYKKIEEGFEIFDDIMAKMAEANSENQREKFQDDLKKEIKKLQRLRDQIKGWQNSSEIKDKDSLSKFRKLIEQRMEIFKDVERENKTKPHSKQGLSAEDKLDPKEKEKCDTIEWLNCQIRRIQDEIDRTESKLETLSSNPDMGKKRGKKDNKGNDKERVDELRRHLERVKFHLLNLEVCIRMINNEKLEIKDVTTKLKEPLEMYIDALDPENDDDPESLDPEDIYDELNFGTYLSQLGGISVNSIDEERMGQNNDNVSHKSSSPTPDSWSSQRNQNGELELHEKVNITPINVSTTTTISTNQSASESASSQKPTVGAAGGSSVTSLKLTRLGSQVSSASSSISSPLPQTPPAVPGIPYNSVAAGKLHTPPIQTASQQNQIITSFTTTSINLPKGNAAFVPSPENASAPNVSLFQSTVNIESVEEKSEEDGKDTEDILPEIVSNKPEVSLITTSSTVTATEQDEDVENGISSTSTITKTPNQKVCDEALSITSETSSNSLSNLSRNATDLPSTLSATPHETSIRNDEYTQQPCQIAGLVDSTEFNGKINSTNLLYNTSLMGQNERKYRSREPQETVIPPWLGASPLGMVPMNDELNYQLQILDTTMQKCPVQMDSEKPRSYLPKMPCQTPPYYPQAPLSNADSLEYYLRLSVETLFFTFYYMEGSRAQLLAAKALKKLSWRFHTKYLMWFQRHEEPKQITDDYEQGTYVYFDFEKWVQRKKEQFTFEYKYLEDKDFE